MEDKWFKEKLWQCMGGGKTQNTIGNMVEYLSREH